MESSINQLCKSKVLSNFFIKNIHSNIKNLFLLAPLIVEMIFVKQKVKTCRPVRKSLFSSFCHLHPPITLIYKVFSWCCRSNLSFYNLQIYYKSSLHVSLNCCYITFSYFNYTIMYLCSHDCYCRQYSWSSRDGNQLFPSLNL